MNHAQMGLTQEGGRRSLPGAGPPGRIDVRAWMSEQTGDPLDMLGRMKFDAIGYHPIEGHPLNLVEQINRSGPNWLSFAYTEAC
jgi:hypothetical protein